MSQNSPTDEVSGQKQWDGFLQHSPVLVTSSDRRRRFVSEKPTIGGRHLVDENIRTTASAECKNGSMLQDQYLKDYLHGLEALSGAHPTEAKVIASHGVVVALDDDEAFEVLLRLVGPQAPVFADELWQLISTFLDSRRAEELFGGTEGSGRTHLNAARRPRYIPPTTRPVIPR